MCVNDLRGYIDFQRQYFQLPVCEKHENNYLTMLRNHQIFHAQSCCLMTNTIGNDTVKIEATGSHCVIFKMNELSKSAKFKSLGIKKPSIDRFMSLSDDPTEKMVCQQISSLVSQHRDSV